MNSRVTERGQITIPKRIRDRLGIRPGQLLEIREDNGRIVAVKSMREDPLENVTGILQTERGSDEILRDLRGEPDGT